MDLITYLPKTDYSINSIATFVDRLSKYAYFVPISTWISFDKLSQVFLATVVAQHRVPARLMSDRNPRLVSAFWKGLVLAFGAQIAFYTIQYPQIDGQLEHLHHSLEQIIRCFVSPQQLDWDLLLPCAECALNNSCNASIGFSLAYTLYGHEPNLPLETAVHSIIGSRVASILDHVAYMSDVIQSVHKTVAQTADSMAKQANRKHHDIKVRLGDQAWLLTEHLRLPSSLSHKISPQFIGPFQVLEAITPVSLRLDLPAGQRIHPIFHVSQLKAASSISADLLSNQVYAPPLDELGKLKVEDILDVRVSCSSLHEFCILWKGYSLFESMWEPLCHLVNAPDNLSHFCFHCNLPMRATASLEGE